MTEWAEHQEFESGWWGNCANTFSEEQKQITYAARMGLVATSNEGHWPSYDLGGKSVVDLGGGPVSMLLKSTNGRALTVVDPCAYPDWVTYRYTAARVNYFQQAAEDFDSHGVVFDECWIYNVLQHVVDPAAVIAKAREIAHMVRLFEWIEIPVSIGHPHVLTAADLRMWLRTQGGTVEDMMSTFGGFSFHGTFKGAVQE